MLLASQPSQQPNAKSHQIPLKDLTKPVYLERDGKGFAEFECYQIGTSDSFAVTRRFGFLFNQQETYSELDNFMYFHSSGLSEAREYLQKQVAVYLQEGYKPASWIPQELNNYQIALNNPPQKQVLPRFNSIENLVCTKKLKIEEDFYHITPHNNQLKRSLADIFPIKRSPQKSPSEELNEMVPGPLVSFISRLKSFGFLGAYLVKNEREGKMRFFKIQWRKNFIKAHEGMEDNKKEAKRGFKRFSDEEGALNGAEEIIRGLVDAGYRFKLENFTYDFYEDEEIVLEALNKNCVQSQRKVFKRVSVPVPAKHQVSNMVARQNSGFEFVEDLESLQAFMRDLDSKGKKKQYREERSQGILSGRGFMGEQDMRENIKNSRDSRYLEMNEKIRNLRMSPESSDLEREIMAYKSSLNNSMLRNFQNIQPDKLRRCNKIMENNPGLLLPFRDFDVNNREIPRSPPRFLQSRDNQATQDPPKGGENIQKTMENQIMKLVEKVNKEEEVDEEKMCVICLDEEASMAFVPCGHKKTCKECCERIVKDGKDCPVCRMKISTALKIFD